MDRLVPGGLAGRYLKATPSDAPDREAIRIAASLAGIRDGYPRMSPAFRRRLAGMLEKGEAPPWLNPRAAPAAGPGPAAGAPRRPRAPPPPPTASPPPAPPAPRPSPHPPPP